MSSADERGYRFLAHREPVLARLVEEYGHPDPFVWHDGGLNPCDVDYRSTLKVGSAHDASLSSIWTGPLYEQYRQAHLSGRRETMSPCGRCEFV